MTRAGFTLFEVLMSLLVLTIAVLSVATLFPMGIRAQQMARYQLYASAKAIEIADSLGANWTIDLHKIEGERLCDSAAINASSFAPDIEHVFSTWGAGMYPLPVELARRLDSDGSEIQQLLDEGGMVFYAAPKPPNMLYADGNRTVDLNLAQEAQRLVFGVTGYAQQNALTGHPMIGWPYWEWYPSPPRTNLSGYNQAQEWERATLRQAGAANAVIDAVFAAPADRNVCDTLCTGCGLTMPSNAAALNPPAYDFDTKAWVPAASFVVAADQVRLPGQVIALRYAAHAWMLAAKGDASLLGTAKLTHERMLRYVQFYSRNFPYDWRAPRNAGAISISDFPLLEFDLFDAAGAVSAGVVDPRYSPAWRSYRVLSPPESGMPLVNRSLAYDNGDNAPPGESTVQRISESWGNPSHYNLTKPFAAAERCRQLVAWAVDWQSYQDFESQPSAPLDASRLAYQPAPNPKAAIDQSPVPIAYSYNRWSSNPEWQFRFQDAARTTICNVASHGPAGGDGDPWPTNEQFYGLHGADRNGNGRFDQGSIAPSVRLKATTVARFNLYDVRAHNRLR